MCEPTPPSRKKVRKLLAASICVAWASCSVAPIAKYLHPRAAMGATCICIVLILAGLYLVRQCIRNGRTLHRAWILALYLAFVTAFAVLYPFLQKHTLNGGSDREDALRIELVAITHHQYPYDARTFLGNPPTPLPGAMLLAAPFYAVGHISWQNLFWLALFLFCLLRLFRNSVTAAFYVVVVFLLSPSNLSDFVTGGDYLVNFFYFAIAITLLIRVLKHSLAWSLSAAAFLGIALSSRSIYWVAMAPLVSLMLQRTTVRKTAVLFATTIIVMSTITLPIFSPHPVHHLLVQLGEGSGKLRYMPASLHAQWLLPLLALVIACSSFFIRIDLSRLFLIFALSTCVVVLPPVVSLAIHAGRLPYECSYLAICVMPYVLWALSRYETLTVGTERQSRDNWLTAI